MLFKVNSITIEFELLRLSYYVREGFSDASRPIRSHVALTVRFTWGHTSRKAPPVYQRVLHHMYHYMHHSMLHGTCK